MPGQLEHPGEFEDLEHLEDVLEAALVLLLLHDGRLLRAEEVCGDLARAAHADTLHGTGVRDYHVSIQTRRRI